MGRSVKAKGKAKVSRQVTHVASTPLSAMTRPVAAACTTSLLDPACVEFLGCDGRVVRCTPVCVDVDFADDDNDGDVSECVPDQHRLWKPEGPGVTSQFLQRFFNAPR